MKNKITLLLAISLNFILTNCNSDDEIIKIDDFNQIKSITTSNPNETYLNRYYEYSNGLITKITTGSGYVYDHEYDNKNRIIRIRNEHYKYYSNGKLSSYCSSVKIIYDANKIIYQEIINDNGDSKTIAELTTDSKERITKIFTPNYSCCASIPVSDVTWQYKYDESGNIVKEFSEDISKADSIVYDNNKNPFYYTFKQVNQYLNAYVKNQRSIHLSIVNENGFSPNNILAIYYQDGAKKEYIYEYNENGLPISVTSEFTSPSGSTSIENTMKYEYY